MSEKPGASKATMWQTDRQRFEHPDGPGKWKEWGIRPRALTREQRLQQRSIINTLERRSPESKHLLLKLAGEKKIDKGRPILDILGVESLPNEARPGRPSMRLSDDALRSIEGFSPAPGFEKRPRDLNPDRLIFARVPTQQRIYVRVFYAESPAQALCHFITLSYQSAPLADVLPTCRIMKGPGDFCWLGWSQTNDDGTLYFPSARELLFIRNGVAVAMYELDRGAHESMMELARKIDALLLKQAKRAQQQAPDPSTAAESDQ